MAHPISVNQQVRSAMTVGAIGKFVMDAAVVRLEVTGLTGRYPLVLTLVAVDTE